jgi:hypothetical protein
MAVTWKKLAYISTVITGIDLASGSWSLVSGLYEYDYDNAAILSTSIVDVIPDNADMAIVQAAVMYPLVTVSAGSIKMYCENAPTGNIGISIVIGS